MNITFLSNEVNRETDTFLPENHMIVTELEPLTIQSQGSSSNHYALLPPKNKVKVVSETPSPSLSSESSVRTTQFQRKA